MSPRRAQASSAGHGASDLLRPPQAWQHPARRPLCTAAVLDALPHFTALLSPEGTVRFVNAPALAAHRPNPGRSRRPAPVADAWWDFDQQAQGQIRLACARAALGETVRLHVAMRTGAGPPTVVDFSVVPVRDGDGNLQQLVASAADSLGQAAADSDLLARYRRKDEFLAMLAHELRNPLAPLRNAAAMLRLSDDQHPQRMAISALVDRQVGHLSRLLDDLLDASRIDQGKIVLSLEPVELGSLLAQALEGARTLTDARGQQVILSRPQRQVWMNADPVRLTQIIDNLISNASKFSDPDSTIKVTLTARQRAGATERQRRWPGDRRRAAAARVRPLHPGRALA